MNDRELASRLREAHCVQFDAEREQALLEAVRRAELRARDAPVPIWRRRVPLWKAAACAAVLLLADRAWLRSKPGTAVEPEPLRIRVERDLFAAARAPGEPVNVSEWAPGAYPFPQ